MSEPESTDDAWRKLEELVIEVRELVQTGKDRLAVARAQRDQAEALIAEMRSKGITT